MDNSQQPEIKADTLTTAYVVKGFWDYLSELPQYAPAGELKEVQHNGEIELMDEIIRRADLVEEAWQSRYASGDICFGGVWDYDISEVFGYEMAIYAMHHKHLPDYDWCRLKVASLVTAIEAEQP